MLFRSEVGAEEYWYVGDNPAKDFVAPNSLGWKTIGVKVSRRVHGRAATFRVAGAPQAWTAWATFVSAFGSGCCLGSEAAGGGA